ncbi:MAG TPA: glycosyltransferase [Pseudobdellovibrionaceae bacterium]|nr:glycosyltransferase [Pseudobdellovibrionaceae bacterium]
MAKIILLSELLDPTTLQLAQSIKNQQHQVTLITSTDAKIENQNQIQFQDIEILYFFSRWSFSEALKLLPLLFQLQPQVIHLILHKSQINWAQSFMGLWAKVLPRCVLSVTFLEIKNSFSRRNLTRYLVEQSDIITCPNLEGLGELRGLDVKSRNQGRSILPPVIDLTKKQVQVTPFEVTDHCHKYLWQQHKEYILIPFYEKYFDANSSFFKRALVLSTFKPLVFWGSYEHWTLRERKKMADWFRKNGLENRWAVTGELSSLENQSLLKRAHSLVLAGLNLYPQEFMGYINQAVENAVQLIIDSQQSNLHAQLWRDTINCWIWDRKNMNRDLQAWIHMPQHQLKSNLKEFLSMEGHLLDSPFNELNRLYTKAIIETSASQ